MSLITACIDGDHHRVKLLLAAGAGPNVADQYGWTPLYYAAHYGHEKIVQLLLAAGSGPNTANQYGCTPLHSAVLNDREAVVPLLLAAGANPNATVRGGWNPLHSAAYQGHEAIVQLLLAAGADPTLSEEAYRTPSQVARTPKIISLLEDSEYVWTHTWTPEEHPRWIEAQRLERVGALSAFRYHPGRRIELPDLPKELQYAVFEHL